MFATISRIIRNSWQHIARNPTHSITAIMVLTLTLFVASLLGLILYSSDLIISHLENRLEVTAFFIENTTEEYILDVKKELELSEKAESVEYISQEEALEIYREQNKDDPELLEFVTADILPASLSVSSENLDDLEVLAKQLSTDERVEQVIYQRDVAEQFRAWSARVRLIGTGIAGYLAIVSLLILLIVLSLNIQSFTQEIEVMRLIGASGVFIRLPFIIDGVLYSLIASAVATGGLYYMLPIMQEFVDDLVGGGIQLFPDIIKISVAFFMASFALGVILSTIGSGLAMRKHLRI